MALGIIVAICHKVCHNLAGTVAWRVSERFQRVLKPPGFDGQGALLCTARQSGAQKL